MLSRVKDIDLKVDHIAIDSETTGLYAPEGTLILLQINDKLIDARTLTKPEIKKLAPVMADRKVKKIFHNASFDCTFLKYHYGWDINGIYDTMLAERILLGDTTIKSSLQATLWRRLGIELAKGYATSFMHMGDSSIPFTEEQLKYGSEDVIHLYDLMVAQIKLIEERNLRPILTIENRLVEIIVDMRVRGVQFDTLKWLEEAHTNEIKFDLFTQDLNELTNNAVDNWNSPKQLKEYLKTRKIYISSVEQLPEYSEDKIVQAIIDMREYHKSVTTYGRSWLETKLTNRAPIQYKSTVDTYGRVRADYNQIIETGRLSCSKPNLQQIPNNVAGNPSNHHSCFVPTAGYKMVISDFTAQELAIIAVGANDKIWLDAIHNGGDLHSIMGKLIFKDEWDKSIHRPITKTLNFGLAYGLSAKGFAERMGIPQLEANSIVRRYFAAVPNIKVYLDNNAEQAIATLSSHSMLGRYRSLENVSEAWRVRNIGKNNPVQSTGADITKLAMIRVDQAIKRGGWPAHILMTIHDEIVSECESDKADEFAIVQQEAMELAATQVLGINLIKAPTKVSDKWEK